MMHWKRIKSWPALSLCITLTGAALAARAAPLSEPPAAAASSQTLTEDHEQDARQILIMLRLQAPHYRGGNYTAGDYGDLQGQAARHRRAERLASAHGLHLIENWPMPLIEVDCFVMAIPVNGDAAGIVQALSREPDVAWAQPMHRYQGEASHRDPLYAVQPAATLWHLAELHELATGRGSLVAVIDSGIEAEHPDLRGQVIANRNLVGNMPPPAELHGTAVAGIVAALADNGIGIAGVAPSAKLLGLRACKQPSGTAAQCTSLALAKALQQAADAGADVINLSLSGPPDPLLAALLDAVMAHGSAVVAAQAPGRDPALAFPAAHPGVIAVSDSFPLAPGTLMAPGQLVPSTVPGEQWRFVSGASFAAAHVSGLMALVHELDREAGRRPATQAELVLQADGGVNTCASLLRLARRHVGACAGVLAAAPTR
ncbi:MAG: S8 family serine peptidase [Burkholderiaceae bacterium]|nr:S8 family serine peptidase [Roseateles sp.]MBV8468395.1 S8 family serine peptidase [Burkholderiaceae bacterium]